MFKLTSFTSSSYSYSIKNILFSRFKSSLIKSEILSNKICLLTLNDSLKLNSLSEEMGQEFLNTIHSLNKEITENKNIKVCIVTGAGDSFSAGGNLNWLEERHNHNSYSNIHTMLNFYNLFLSIRNLNIPTIAAINGHAIGFKYFSFFLSLSAVLPETVLPIN